MILIYVFAAQAVVGAIVLVVLKKVLDNMLVDLALRQLDFFQRSTEKIPASSLTICFYKTLRPQDAQRLQKILQTSFGPGVPTLQQDRRLLGGIFFKIGDKELDCSLRNRLKQALGRK